MLLWTFVLQKCIKKYKFSTQQQNLIFPFNSTIFTRCLVKKRALDISDKQLQMRFTQSTNMQN